MSPQPLVPHLNTISFLDSGNHFPDLVGSQCLFVSQYCSSCLCSSGTLGSWGWTENLLALIWLPCYSALYITSRPVRLPSSAGPAHIQPPGSCHPYKMKFYCPVNVYSSNVYEACCYPNKMLRKRTQRDSSQPHDDNPLVTI